MKNNLIIILIIIAFLFGLLVGNNNSKTTYGTNNSPSNCRALISENIDGYRKGIYEADKIINAIDKYCGENGSNWNEK